MCMITKISLKNGTKRKRSTFKHIVRLVGPDLAKNPPEVRATSGQNPCTKIIYIVFQTSVGLFKISSQNNSFLATPNVENEC